MEIPLQMYKPAPNGHDLSVRSSPLTSVPDKAKPIVRW